MAETEDPFDRETRGRAMGKLRSLAGKTATATLVPETVLVGRDPLERLTVVREGFLGVGRKTRVTVELAEHRWQPGGWRLHGMTLEDREAFTGRQGKYGTGFVYDSYVSREVWLRRNGQLEVCDIDFCRLASETNDPTVGRRSVLYDSDPRPASVGGLIFFEKRFTTSARWRGDTKVSFQDQRKFAWVARTPFEATFKALQRLSDGHAVDHPADTQFYW